ncbi:MAG: sulfotransferase family 2 domain-containing protein [Verrucomicrobiota bacterium]
MSIFLIHEPRCVFIHIPKTAGTSIRKGFFKENYSGPYHDGIPDDWADAFSFAFVRNPYDRIISSWKMFTSGTDEFKGTFPPLPLKAFLEIVTNDAIPHTAGSTNYPELVRHHTLPLTHPANHLDKAQFIGRMENLEADFASICEEIGAEYAPLNKRQFTQRRADFQSYYCPETKKIVSEYFRDDFDRLNYSWDI